MEYITVLGESIPKSVYDDIAEHISSELKGYKLGCATSDFECSICYGGSETPTVITECDHIYHVECLEKWMEQNNSCPLCRNIMPGCTNTLVGELFEKVKMYIKLSIMKSWWDKLEGLSQEQIGKVSEQMKDLIDSKCWMEQDDF
jgi:hypothetical protein